MRLVVATFLMLHGLGDRARAEVRVEARLGFGSVHVDGLATPLVLRIRNGESSSLVARIRARGSDAGAIARWSVEREVEVSPGATRQLNFLVPTPTSPSVDVSLRTDAARDYVLDTGKGSVARKNQRELSFRMPAKQWSMDYGGLLVLGARGRQLAAALRVPDDAKALYLDSRPVTPVALDEEWAPDSAAAYSAFSSILWTEPNLADLSDPAQLRALLDWVEQGGRLVLLSAARPMLLDATELREVAPRGPRVLGTADYPQLSGMQEPLSGDLPWLEMKLVSGDRRVPPPADPGFGDRPASVERRLGRGVVVVASFDPLRYDLGQPDVLARAVGAASGVRMEVRAAPDDPPPPRDALGGSRVYELLANDNVQPPPLGLLFLLGVFYVVLIGPFDYQWLKGRKKLSMSPLTLLAYSTLFTGACVGGTFVMFASDEQVNCVAYLDLGVDRDGREVVDGIVHHGVFLPFGGDEVIDARGLQVFGGFATGDREDWRGPEPGSYKAGEQAWEGPGRQPLQVSLGFNSLRVSSQRVRGTGTSGIELSFRRLGETFECSVHNGLDRDLSYAVLGTRDGVVDVGPVAPGETRIVHVPAVDTEFGTRLGLSSPAQLRTLYPPAQPMRGVQLPERSWVREQLLGAVEAWSVAGVSAEDSPWRIELEPEQVALVGLTDGLPFDDGLAHRDRGFDRVFVRTVTELAGRGPP